MKQVTAYRCQHCGKLFMRDYNCRKHEPQCTKNPLVRPLCYDCKFYEQADYNNKEEVKIWYDDGFGGDYTTKSFAPNKCAHPEKGCKLFANIHMGEDTYISLTDEGWEAMPTPKEKCPYFEQHKYGKIREI